MDLEFTDYARMRMHQRDILEEEVHAALAASSSKHLTRKDGRSEVRERMDGRVLLIVYQRLGELLLVINAMWEG